MMKNRNADDAITYANRMSCASKDVGQSIVGEATSERLTNRKVVQNETCIRISCIGSVDDTHESVSRSII